jgi:hypothetical protein
VVKESTDTLSDVSFFIHNFTQLVISANGPVIPDVPLYVFTLTILPLINYMVMPRFV